MGGRLPPITCITKTHYVISIQNGRPSRHFLNRPLPLSKVPILYKTNTPLRWCESFKNVRYTTFGVRTAPLLYIMRETVDVRLETGVDPNISYDPCMVNKSHGLPGFILQDLIHHKLHAHPLYKHDNATLFTMIEEAARAMHYNNTIQPFKRAKNGRGA